jgi:serine/threonine protein kinase
MRVNLRVLAGPYAGRVFSFDRHDTFLIGRSNAAHLCLPDDRFFSRNHCMLEIAPPRCFLRDLGSTNGTFVNGQKVQQAFLQNGDRLQGGQTVLAVEVSADIPPPVPDRRALPPTQPSMVLVECLRCGRRDTVQASSPSEKFSYICEDCRIELKNEPQPVPGYEIIKVLGRGGMGTVVLARHLETGNTVAIKTLLPEVAVNEQALKRFMREIDVAAALQHPNIVRFLDRGINMGVVYLVTEFVEGADAAHLADARGGRLPYQEALCIVIQSLEAISFAHSKGFIHRDIKDQNILVTGAWPGYTAKLTDFGLAKSFKQTGMSGITMAGDMAGTFAYMPPEQIRDFQNVQPASDIYAMGMTAYSLLAGSIALDISPRANAAETIKAIFEKPIIPLVRFAPEVPLAVVSIVERAISKEPAERWHSAEAMKNALKHALT